jgi:hypothetical protein
MSNSKHIVVSIVEGHVVRNLLENGLLDLLGQKSFQVTLVTPATLVPAFRKRWQRSWVRFAQLEPLIPSRRRSRLNLFRRKLARSGWRRCSRLLLDWERRMMGDCPPEYLRIFDETRYDVVLATHIHLPLEAPILNGAYVRGIPSVGVVNSWDNVYKGIGSHPDLAVVWNDVNRQEMIDFEGYHPDSVKPIGVPAFDPYFDPSNIWSRERFCRQFDLDPTRPILLYSTIGQYVRCFEETYLLEALLRAIAGDRFRVRPQIICRLHPWTKQELFAPYRQHFDVRFSRYENYVPTLDWCPTKDEVILAANILRHSAVCITPGSTMALEAAVFDTPVVVPIFNDWQPGIWRDYYARFCLAWHFGRLVREKLVPLAHNLDELVGWITKYLDEPSLLQLERKRIVRDYVMVTDGQATKRLADTVASFVR